MIEEKQWNCKKLNVTTDKKLKIKAIALNVPGRDVAFSISKGMKLTQQEVIVEEKRLKGIIREWQEQASSLKQEHLVIIPNIPSGYRDTKKHSMVLCFEVSVLLNDIVEKKHNPWPQIFIDDLNELKELLK